MSTNGLPESFDMAAEFPIYNAKQSEMFKWMGAAMSAWSENETHLFRIYALASGLPEATAASLMLHVKSFALALDMTDTAVRCKFEGQPVLTWWISLTEFLRELSGDRNFIAHSPCMALSPDRSIKLEQCTPVLVTSVLSSLAGEYPKGTEMGSGDVQQSTYDFRLAGKYLLDFIEALASTAPDLTVFSIPIVRRRPSRAQRLEAARKAQKRPNRPPRPNKGTLTSARATLDQLRGN